MQRGTSIGERGKRAMPPRRRAPSEIVDGEAVCSSCRAPKGLYRRTLGTHCMCDDGPVFEGEESLLTGGASPSVRDARTGRYTAEGASGG